MSLFRPMYVDKKTGERKESGTWWFEFVIGGRRIRESTKTCRKTIAADFEARRRREIEKRLAEGGDTPKKSTRMLQTVATILKEYRALYDGPHHSDRSIAWVGERSKPLLAHLGSSALMDLTEGKISSYMRTRSKAGNGPRTINMDLECLSRAIGRTWSELWPNVPRLKEPTDVGRALSSEEEGRILGAAAENKSPYILPFIRIALLTGMRAGEIRRMQVFQLDIEKRQIRVGKAKTEAGTGRPIPMNAAMWETVSGQLDWLREKFGKLQPNWYLFPFCDRVQPVDPSKPVTTVKSSWESVRLAAGVSCRFHDLRHTAATKMAENDVPEATMKALMGHLSRAMLERYSHIRDEAKRDAVEGLSLATPVITMKPKKDGVPKVSPKVSKKRAG